MERSFRVSPHLESSQAEDGRSAALEPLDARGRLKGGLECKRPCMAKPAAQRLLYFILRHTR